MAKTHLRRAKVRKQIATELATATTAVAATQTLVTFAGGILSTGTASTGGINAAAAKSVLTRIQLWLGGPATNRRATNRD